MTTSKPVTVMCLYRVAKGKQSAFLRLLAKHWPTLRRAGLASEEPALILRGKDRQGRTVFVETFEWASARASAAAHRSPEIMALWGPMGELAEEMDFLSVQPVGAVGPGGD